MWWYRIRPAAPISNLFDNSEEYVSDPWRCQGLCGELIYNIEWRDGHPYPAPGAPVGLFLSDELHCVCKVCWDLWMVLERADSEYWKKAQETDKKSRKKLGRGGNYLTE